MDTKVKIGLIICTRNRPKRVAKLLEQLGNGPADLAFILIVDSSDSKDTEVVVSASREKPLTYLYSEPGLPAQRNAGVSYALNHWHPDVICFLDDDVEVPSNYFENVVQAFAEQPGAACIAGFDLNLRTAPSSLSERVFFLRGRADFGKLLPSGMAIPITNFSGILETDWAPGHSLNVATWALKKVQFNSKIRMYGEDVEFLIRLAKVGKIYTSSQLGVSHNPEKSGRDGVAEAEAYNAGFRWWLTREYPGRFSTTKTFIASAALMAGYMVRGCLKRDRIALERAKGLGTFFARLLTGRRVTQTFH